MAKSKSQKPAKSAAPSAPDNSDSAPDAPDANADVEQSAPPNGDSAANMSPAAGDDIGDIAGAEDTASTEKPCATCDVDAPHSHLPEPPAADAPASTHKRVRFIEAIASADWSILPGEIVELPNEIADGFADGARAVLHEGDVIGKRIVRFVHDGIGLKIHSIVDQAEVITESLVEQL